MVYGVYSIRDVKTGFMSPVIEVSDESAKRNFFHSISQSDGILFTYSQDFSLYHVADFDTHHGTMIPVTPIVPVAEGSDAVKEVSHA